MDKIKGKNFSGNSNKNRPNSDYYPTPYSMVYQLLEKEYFDINKSIIEPCCGKILSIVKVLQKNNFNNIIYYDKYFGNNKKDFLLEKNKYDYCITNPPFKLAKDFILKLKQIINDKFALLLPLSYLHGQWRFENIYKDKIFPLKKVYVFTRYPLLCETIDEDGTYETGMQVYAWFIWDKNYSGDCYIDWIDNNKYVKTTNLKNKKNNNFIDDIF